METSTVSFVRRQIGRRLDNDPGATGVTHRASRVVGLLYWKCTVSLHTARPCQNILLFGLTASPSRQCKAVSMIRSSRLRGAKLSTSRSIF